MRTSILSFLLSCWSLSIFAQNFPGTIGVITDNSTTDFNVTVSGLASSIDTSTFGFQSMCLNLNHNNDEDLDAKLISPNGTEVQLFYRLGGTSNNYLTLVSITLPATKL